MNFFTFSGIIIALVSFLLGIFVFFWNRKKKVNQLFSLFAFSVGIWGFGAYKVGITASEPLSLFWWKIAHIGVIFIPVFFLHFIYAFLNIKRKKLVLLCYLLGVFFLFSNFFTDLFISNMKWVFNSFYWDSPPGIIYPYFVFFFLIVILYAHFELFKVFKKSSGIQRAQIKYFFLATIIGFSGGSTSFLPCFGINIYPIFNITIAFAHPILAYAIIRYRLMDIQLILGRTAVYVLSFVTVIVLAFGLMYLNKQLEEPFDFNIFGPMLIVLSIFLYQLFFRFYEIIASRYFYYTFYSYQKVLTDLGKKLNQFLDVEQLSDLISSTLIDTMKLDRAVILSRKPDIGIYEIKRNIGFKEENGISLVRDNFLTEYLEKTQKPLVYEELGLIIRDTKNEEEKQKLRDLQKNMKKIEAELCLPLLMGNEIIGMIVLGNKVSREPYSEQDINLLILLSSQAGIAFQNAGLYEQLEDLSRNLQQKVDEQTKEIKEAYEVEKKGRELAEKAGKELERLDVAKNQFIVATQHHLRTPLTSMRGYIDLILKGTYGKISKKLKEIIGKFQTSTDREIKIVNELLDISQFQLGKEIVDLKPNIDINLIIKEIIEELKFEAETKKIYLKLQKPKEKVPLVSADSERLKIALFNIIDNAIKYTNKGGVVIKFKIEKQPYGEAQAPANLKIIVEDTGIGISKEEIPNLFNRTFERGESAQKVYTTGRGIGLFISAKIIEAHNARIWAESEGKDKGSTFYVELPVK